MTTRQDIADFLTEHKDGYPLLLSFGIMAAVSFICELHAKTAIKPEDLKTTCDVLEEQLTKEKVKHGQ